MNDDDGLRDDDEAVFGDDFRLEEGEIGVSNGVSDRARETPETSGDVAEDDLAARRRLWADKARRARAKRRAAREAAERASEETASGCGVPGAAISAELLATQIRRADRHLAMVESDPNISLLDKTKLFVAAVASLSRGIDNTILRRKVRRFRQRLERVEGGDHSGRR